MIFLRLITVRLLLLFLAVLGVLLGVQCLVDGVAHTRVVEAYGADAVLVWRLNGLHLPLGVFRLTPFAVLLASTMAVLRHRGQGEWLALQACGQGTARRVAPFLLFGGLVTLGLISFQETIAPRFLADYHHLLNMEIKKRDTWQGDVHAGRLVARSHSVFWHVEDGRIPGEPKNVTGWILGADGLPASRLDAEKMRYRLQEDCWFLENAEECWEQGTVIPWSGTCLTLSESPDTFLPQTALPAEFPSSAFSGLAARRIVQGMADYPVWAEAVLRATMYLLAFVLAVIPTFGLSRRVTRGASGLRVVLGPFLSGVGALTGVAIGYALAQKGLVSPIAVVWCCLFGFVLPFATWMVATVARLAEPRRKAGQVAGRW